MRVFPVVLLAALAVGCGAAASSTTTGLSGLVMRGPVSPVCRAGVPCSKPAAHVTIQFTRDGDVVASARTDAKGRYRIALPAGSYAVRTPRRYGMAIRPGRALVRAGLMRRVDLAIDTGIR
jgi:hypothetical protein